jgi:hypothetical protein
LHHHLVNHFVVSSLRLPISWWLLLAGGVHGADFLSVGLAVVGLKRDSEIALDTLRLHNETEHLDEYVEYHSYVVESAGDSHSGAVQVAKFQVTVCI